MKFLTTILLCLTTSTFVEASELRIGSSTVSITPERPVALAGQFGTRISQSVEAPIIAAAVAIESVEGGKVVDQSILISCDLVGIHHSVLAQFRQHLKPLLPDFDVRKVIVSATHTHTAPVTSEIPEETLITYPIPKEGVMQPAEYTAFLVERLSQALIAAGIKAPVRARIRDEIWIKLWGNLSFNPVSALTGGTLQHIAEDPATRKLVRQMMVEAESVAKALGAKLSVDVDTRIGWAQDVGHFKTSMLQDLEAGRPMEIDALVTVVAELGDIAGIDTPTIDTVLALVIQRARLKGCYPG